MNNSILVFAGYSKRFLTAKLSEGNPGGLNRSGSRSIRVLWYLKAMGEGWISGYELRKIGAVQWRVFRYAIPDLRRDQLIDEVQYTRRGKNYTRYRINDSGKEVLEMVGKHVEEEYKKAVERCRLFKADIK